jgi:uncharacterized membrane protein YhiD involved in acid resistance
VGRRRSNAYAGLRRLLSDHDRFAIRLRQRPESKRTWCSTPSRIAAQVASGIGFLGAGSIVARGEIVKGLTTAASIWTVAAIGLAVGGALYLAAGTSTIIIIILIILALAGIKPLEEAYRSHN